MSNGYDIYGFRKNSSIIRESITGRDNFLNAEEKMYIHRNEAIKVEYAFGDIPEDSVFENPGMNLGAFCNFMTKAEIDALTNNNIKLDIEEIKLYLTDQYNRARNLVVYHMSENILEKITLKKFNNNGDILYTTNFATKVENVPQNYILFSKNTEAIQDLFSAVYESAHNDTFFQTTKQAEKGLTSLEKSKAKRKIMTFKAINNK